MKTLHKGRPRRIGIRKTRLISSKRGIWIPNSKGRLVRAVAM